MGLRKICQLDSRESKIEKYEYIHSINISQVDGYQKIQTTHTKAQQTRLLYFSSLTESIVWITQEL